MCVCVCLYVCNPIRREGCCICGYRSIHVALYQMNIKRISSVQARADRIMPMMGSVASHINVPDLLLAIICAFKQVVVRLPRSGAVVPERS